MGLLELILPIAIAAATPQSRPDTCAMASLSIHVQIAQRFSRLQRSSKASKKSHQTAIKHNAPMVKSFIGGNNREGAQHSLNMSLIHNEKGFFKLYRIRNEFNPCKESWLLKEIEEIQKNVRNQCINSGNPFAVIKIGRHDFSSENFLRDSSGIVFSETCFPMDQLGTYFKKHQVANAYDVGPERLCNAAWRGITESWEEIKSCATHGRFVDMREWAKGNFVEVSGPPK